MTDENKFCTACGAMLPEGAEFCPECGAGIGGRANPHAFAQGPGYGMQQRSGPPTVSILILIYGLLAAVFGISAIYLGLTFTGAIPSTARFCSRAGSPLSAPSAHL